MKVVILAGGYGTRISEESQLKPYIDLPKMAEAAEGMIVDALEAFLRGDAELAAEVTRRDDYMDQLKLYAIDLPEGMSLASFQQLKGEPFLPIETSVKTVAANLCTKYMGRTPISRIFFYREGDGSGDMQIAVSKAHVPEADFTVASKLLNLGDLVRTTALRPLKDTSVQRVINTAALILQAPASPNFYLRALDRWWQSPALAEGWEPAIYKVDKQGKPVQCRSSITVNFKLK